MNILIICSGNTCRSPMGAGLLRLAAKSRGLSIDVLSAGLFPNAGQRVTENAVTVMKELGIDISDDYSKPVTRDLLDWADAVVLVKRDHADYLIEEFQQIASKIRILEDDVEDPFGGTVANYRDARNTLLRLLSRLMDSFKTS